MFYRKFCRSYTTPAKSLSVFQRSALGAACDDLISDVLRHRLVVRRLHDILATALSLGTQVGGVAEHLSQRNECVDTLGASHCLHALDLTTASIQIADDIAQILIGNDDSDLHDRLGDDRISLAHSILEGHRTCNGEGHLRGVDLMIRAIPQGDLDVNDRIACQNAGLHSTLDTVVDSRDVFLRDSAANDGVDELITLTGLVGLDLDLDMTVLALTTRLTSVLGLLVGLLADGLTVSDLRCADVRLDLELTEQTVNDDLQMELAHAGDDGLTSLLVGVGLEGRILFGQLCQRDAHLLVAGLGLRLDGDADNGLGELHGLQNEGWDYEVNAELGVRWIPEKSYGSLTFPAGNYEALNITIGEGAGKNWWCVLYPPLCLLDVQEEESEAEDVLRDSIMRGKYSVLYDAAHGERQTALHLRFKVLELFGAE